MDNYYIGVLNTRHKNSLIFYTKLCVTQPKTVQKPLIFADRIYKPSLIVTVSGIFYHTTDCNLSVEHDAHILLIVCKYGIVHLSSL